MTIADEAATVDETAESGRTALYRLYSADDELLYIGISDNLSTRMSGHAQVQPWWDEVARKTVVWYPRRAQADTAETIAIGLEQPKYNKAKRYVRLPEQPFPGSDSGPEAWLVRAGVTLVRCWRDASGTLLADVLDGGNVVRCGIGKDYWWCACAPGTRLCHPEPRHCCAHLLRLGVTPRSTQHCPPGDSVGSEVNERTS